MIYKNPPSLAAEILAQIPNPKAPIIAGRVAGQLTFYNTKFNLLPRLTHLDECLVAISHFQVAEDTGVNFYIRPGRP